MKFFYVLPPVEQCISGGAPEETHLLCVFYRVFFRVHVAFHPGGGCNSGSSSGVVVVLVVSSPGLGGCLLPDTRCRGVQRYHDGVTKILPLLVWCSYKTAGNCLILVDLPFYLSSPLLLPDFQKVPKSCPKLSRHTSRTISLPMVSISSQGLARHIP